MAMNLDPVYLMRPVEPLFQPLVDYIRVEFGHGDAQRIRCALRGKQAYEPECYGARVVAESFAREHGIPLPEWF